MTERLDGEGGTHRRADELGQSLALGALVAVGESAGLPDDHRQELSQRLIVTSHARGERLIHERRQPGQLDWRCRLRLIIERAPERWHCRVD
ncbi:hypothetical protein [Micromonospora sp. WMMD980]|uniref:hypothetical protein n=1 Tax=Micromonospora sp. WMMD980 TaxID=3016088 RepID=UPI002415AA8B|nr:hypothetical protein [Micromonospora sp. WMMD980]MDG4799507.1 hypothetical protein [Micromonospora sp. WMMD980]